MISKITQLSMLSKQVIVILFDILIVEFSAWLALFIRLGSIEIPSKDVISILIIAPILSSMVFISFNQYRAVLRYIGLKTVWQISKSVTIFSLIWGLLIFLLDIKEFPRSVFIIHWLICVISLVGFRFFAKWLLLKSNNVEGRSHKSTIIYGAGQAGRQLAEALIQSNEFKIIGFFDGTTDLISRYINGVKVYPPTSADEVIRKFQIDEILIASDSFSNKKKNEIIRDLEKHKIKIKILPKVSELVEGKVKIEDLRNIRIDDVLGREKVKPIPKLLMKNITDKNVLVTGAGGSIGSELCKQVIILKAKKIILVESSELALYKIEKELRNLKLDCEIQPHLCSITDRATIKRIYKAYKVQTVYHAAAYKHVPLVELNILEGIKNNVLGTVNCALSAMEADVETFVLISSDKAVRPTNIMGATKRISELVLQGLSNIKNNTTFSMVRFGNVIDSSGSVVPLFRDQIKNGGPVTLTDKRITRYFMTIHEAVELVIQAGAMANGGEVFVLDMGEPVKIYDLAQKMIYLSGLEERNDKNESGEIEIQITGLRPGEKLYEELLIDNNSFPTEHPRILKAREYQLDWDVIEDHISLFRDTIEKHDVTEAIKIVSNIVKGYSPVNATADLLYLKNKEL